MSAAADRLFDDYWFVLARPGRARGPGGDQGRPAPPAMRKTLLNAVKRKPQVMVKITSFAGSKERLAAHLDYISRNGKNEVFDPTGSQFSAIGAQMGLAGRDALQHYGGELAAGPIPDGPVGKKKGRPRSRVSMNLMLSMPAGTDTGAFELAVRDFLGEQFRAHDHLFTFHDDRDHYHAHVVVGLQSHDGRWLNPRKGDLLAWCENFAASLPTDKPIFDPADDLLAHGSVFQILGGTVEQTHGDFGSRHCPLTRSRTGSGIVVVGSQVEGLHLLFQDPTEG
jgi:hypothetical protein